MLRRGPADRGVSAGQHAPVTRHELVDLVGGAWLKVGLLTSDLRLARTCPDAEAIDD